MGMGLVASLAWSARADALRASVVAVDARAHTVTALQGKRPYVFTVTDKTRFLDAKGTLLAVGLKAGNIDVLTAATQKGYFKPGAQLTLTFDSQSDELPLSQLQFLDTTRQDGGDAGD